MENTFNIDFPVFGDYTICVVITNDVVEARRARDLEIDERFYGVAEALHCYNEKLEGLAWLFFNYKTTPGIIAHEAHHAVYRMMEWIGAKSVDQEIFAYHAEHIVDKVWNFIKKLEREKIQCQVNLNEIKIKAQSQSLANFVDC